MENHAPVTNGLHHVPRSRHSFKSPYRSGLPMGDQLSGREHDDAGACTGVHLEFSPTGVHLEFSPTQRPREGRPGRQTRDGLRSASMLPLPKCTGDADHRFYPLPSGRERPRAAIQSAERPASPSLVRYEFCRRDNSEHIRDRAGSDVARPAGSRDPTSHGVCSPPIVPRLRFAKDCECSCGLL
jgi:hypothetical protein